MSIANYITFMRIFICPIFLLVYMQHQTLGISAVALPYVLLALMGISELSDAFDGHLARKYDQVTDLGKILDPMADSISRISVFLTFTLPPVNLSILLIFIFIYRDSMVSTLRTICALKGFALAARPSGKVKAVIQAIAAFIILLCMIPHSMGQMSDRTLNVIATWAVSIAAVYTIYSAIDYVIANKPYIVRLLTLPKKGAS